MPISSLVRARALLIDSDLPAILNIEKQCFKHPWTAAEFKDAATQNGATPFAIERINQRKKDRHLIAYIFARVHKNGTNIITMGVHPSYRRIGVGRYMIETAAAFNERIKYVQTLVAETNIAAQLFFKHCGFKAIKIIRNPYATSTDDGYLMYRHRMGISDIAHSIQK